MPWLWLQTCRPSSSHRARPALGAIEACARNGLEYDALTVVPATGSSSTSISSCGPSRSHDDRSCSSGRVSDSCQPASRRSCVECPVDVDLAARRRRRRTSRRAPARHRWPSSRRRARRAGRRATAAAAPGPCSRPSGRRSAEVARPTGTLSGRSSSRLAATDRDAAAAGVAVGRGGEVGVGVEGCDPVDVPGARLGAARPARGRRRPRAAAPARPAAPTGCRRSGPRRGRASVCAAIMRIPLTEGQARRRRSGRAR